MIKVILIGRLTADPTKAVTQSGINVTSFTIAANKLRGGTEFFRVSTWRGLADTCAKFLSKGRQVSVIGELQTRTYQNKFGETKTSLEVQADEVEFLSPAEEKEKPAEKKADAFADISTDDLPWGD